MEDCGPSTGVFTPFGKSLSSVESFSETIWRALYISVPQSNSTQTIEKPLVEVERTRRTLVAPLRTVSIGKVTDFSTSSGAYPLASVITVTVGAFKSGNTSTSELMVTIVPPINRKQVINNISILLCNENCMILFSIGY